MSFRPSKSSIHNAQEFSDFPWTPIIINSHESAITVIERIDQACKAESNGAGLQVAGILKFLKDPALVAARPRPFIGSDH